MLTLHGYPDPYTVLFLRDGSITFDNADRTEGTITGIPLAVVTFDHPARASVKISALIAVPSMKLIRCRRCKAPIGGYAVAKYHDETWLREWIAKMQSQEMLPTFVRCRQCEATRKLIFKAR